MQQTITRLFCSALVAVGGLLMWSASAAAQDVSGQARAIEANILGVSTTLADTGTLSSADDAREASMLMGSIPSLGGAETLHAATISSIYDWDAGDSVASEASVANLGLNVGGNSVRADFILAEALAPVFGSSVGSSSIDGLTVNGVPINVTGEPNQTIDLIGGRLVINEQQATSTGGTVVNALHIVINGVADVVIATASASVSPESSGDGGLLGGLLGGL